MSREYAGERPDRHSLLADGEVSPVGIRRTPVRMRAGPDCAEEAGRTRRRTSNSSGTHGLLHPWRCLRGPHQARGGKGDRGRVIDDGSVGQEPRQVVPAKWPEREQKVGDEDQTGPGSHRACR